MSTAKIIESKYRHAALVSVNGRSRYMPMIESIEAQPDGYSFIVKHRNLADKFVVWGGKKSGGRANEWFIDWPAGRSMKSRSLMDALKILNGM